ncbi:MAG: hypothetical protein HKP18_11895, partial [Acidimicrobiia bacterium]|nr:hypothetical protein [Acidimicrobiia bacterium]
PGDADHLATRLALLRDDAAVTAAGAAARARYLETYSATQGLADLEAVYERVARTISDGRATRR